MATSKIKSSTQLTVDADLDMGTHKLTGLSDGSANTDAVTVQQLNAIIGTADALTYKGATDCSANPNYPAANAGDTYKVSVAGKIGGASGTSVAVGDLFICTADSTASGTQAAVGQYWDVIHVADAAGTVTSTAATPLDNQIVRLDSTTGTVIQNSLATIDDSGSVNIPTGQAYKVNGTALVSNATHTGDVTGDTALTIAANAVTFAKMAQAAADTAVVNNTASTANLSALAIGEQTVLGRITGGHIAALTVSQLLTMLNISAGTIVTREVPSGTKNGSNPTFTLAHTPVSGSEQLYLNGQLLNQGAGNDYTISADTITMLTGMIPVSTDVLLCSYRY